MKLIQQIVEADLRAQYDAALNDLRAALKSNDPNSGRSWAEYRPIQDRPYNQEGREFDVRDWGVWENPDDARDEEDYDWKRPTKKTVDTLVKIMKDVQKRHKKVELHFSVEEKNWIILSAEPKKAKKVAEDVSYPKELTVDKARHAIEYGLNKFNKLGIGPLNKVVDRVIMAMPAGSIIEITDGGDAIDFYYMGRGGNWFDAAGKKLTIEKLVKELRDHFDPTEPFQFRGMGYVPKD